MPDPRESETASPPPGATTPPQTLREKLWVIIFETDTPAGKAFDIALLVAIVLSVLAVILESVPSIDEKYHGVLTVAEWGFTIIFSIEYAVRMYCVRSRLRYATSFFGVVDLASVLPTYISLLVPGSQSLLTIRALRLLRVFRVFKLARFLTEGRILWTAIQASRAKITVFLVTVVVVVIIMASAMHLIEGPTNEGFRSIPHSMYWAVVTMTTVGYGDATPETVPGKTLAALMMIIGYSMIIVPTGIVSAELARGGRPFTSRTCGSCERDGHDEDADHCKFCGQTLN
jgi:voltage-gated potassium channel